MFRRFVVLAAVLFGAAPAHAQKNDPACDRHLEKSRELVHDMWSFTFAKAGAVDIDGTAEALKPAAASAKTADECADVLDRFMASLRDGHANLTYYPGRTLRSAPEGIRIRRFKDKLIRPGRPQRQKWYVTEVYPTSPELEGVIAGAEVLAIDGEPVARVAERIEERMSASTTWGREHWTDRSLLRGPAGTPVVLKLRSADGGETEVTLQRPEVSPDEKERERLARAALDTAQLARWKRLDDGYGYLKFTTFATEKATEQLDAALDSLKDTKGLVIDLRDNGGGYVKVLIDAVGRFFPKKTIISQLLVRIPGRETAEKNFEPWIAHKRKWTYGKPVVLIVDAGCFSACDLFANAIDENGRGILVGPTATGGGSASPTGGGVFPEWDGVQIRFSFWVAYRQDGQHIEGRGVRPHIIVEPTLEDYVAGRDALLEAALEALRSGQAKALGG